MFRLFKRFGGRRAPLETLSEIYMTLSDVLAGRAKTPIISVDDGAGKTLETYYVGEVRVRIGVDEAGDGFYKINEPPLTLSDELIYAHTLRSLYYELRPEEAESRGVEEYLRSKVNEVAEAVLGEPLDPVSAKRITYYLNREVFGYGPIQVPVLDEEVEDIKCVDAESPVIVAHARYGNLGWLKTNIWFEGDNARLDDFVRRLAHMGGRGISFAVPYVDCQLRSPAGGYIRFAGTLGREVTRGGSSFTIRKFPEVPLSLKALIKSNMLSPLMAAYLWYVCELKRVFFVAGPTGSGKTTLLNAILGVLDPRLSYITIEDTYELRLPSWRWISLSTRRSWTIVESKFEIDIQDLIAMAMRMRPDYLIVGEVRTPEQLIGLLLSATTGHGAMTSIHAQDPENLLVRLTTMGVERSALDILWGCAITQIIRPEKARTYETIRRVTKVAEFIPGEQKTDVATIFAWDPVADSFYPDDLDELWDRSKRLQILSNELKMPKERILESIRQREVLLREVEPDFDSLSRKVMAFYTAAAR
ncbi:MAG: type II/IV secretion system ATPase subunit [Thermosphaera sp.]